MYKRQIILSRNGAVFEAMNAVVLQLRLHRETTVAGNLRRIIAAPELAAAHAKLFRRKQTFAECGLRGTGYRDSSPPPHQDVYKRQAIDNLLKSLRRLGIVAGPRASIPHFHIRNSILGMYEMCIRDSPSPSSWSSCVASLAETALSRTCR